ncbi:efflux transporter, RND family, MFP subunit [Desulfovibrio sp. X2]|uniref:efflux RND transporter periplasmic adaptor subunit n=1 Tax=Desulfovibrio sp. X2 TaxID=941449 RepID=UPI000358F06D|nr:efflux RND transporter periplasmic adaptor subunit [Desulfovibrio sp. X2]EPR44678.1 efflux transporter, RND family, MFP subunit [Desulfovibrio sp. X2]
MRHAHPLCFLLLAFLALPACGGDVAPGQRAAREGEHAPQQSAQAVRRMVQESEESVGTVRPKTEISVAAQVLARVASVLVRPGARVDKGQTLVTLDPREFEARSGAAAQSLAEARASLGQSEQAITAARAQADKTRTTYERLRALYAQGAVAAEEMESARRDMLQAAAALNQAREGQAQAQAAVRRFENLEREADINQGYTVITAPEAGEVVRRLVEPGDVASPGKPLLVLQTGGKLWLEAAVREGLIGRTPVGERLTVHIDSLSSDLPGTVEEVVPSADPATRTFIVRVGLPPAQGLYQGMFGRLIIPVGQREAVLVPRAALRRVGQLSTVLLKTAEGWRDVYVRLGRVQGGEVEVLAGLSGGETVGLSDASGGGADAE